MAMAREKIESKRPHRSVTFRFNLMQANTCRWCVFLWQANGKLISYILDCSCDGRLINNIKLIWGGKKKKFRSPGRYQYIKL